MIFGFYDDMLAVIRKPTTRISETLLTLNNHVICQLSEGNPLAGSTCLRGPAAAYCAYFLLNRNNIFVCN